ncbi:MAG TPA: polysaccharide deacetylase family protein, partial [Kineosporiaceae bacterium]|nr:polysaccharide deacetylase family protein [Kineosporiaceae bacterium]
VPARVPAAPMPVPPPPWTCPGRPAPAAVRTAPGSVRTVALTFDDGPSRWTPQVLDVLKRYQVSATFFVVGVNAQRDPQAVTAEAAAGHLVGNHTWTHITPPPRTGWPAARLGSELDRTSAVVRQLTGARTCWFRPPAGILAGAAGPATARGMAVVVWSVDSKDWLVQKGARADGGGALARRITARATVADRQDHPVVLLHDGGGYRGATAAALPAIIGFYRSHGYTFVRMDGH